MSGTDLFYRWYWLVAKSSDFANTMAKMPRKDEPQRKWRAVQRSSYVDNAGVKMACAVLYR